ncbi:MAG: ribonuclease III [Candidatus Binatia bacterium]
MADDVDSLESRLGHSFLDPGLLDAALTHTSALSSGVVRASEQLEWLGDAVIGLAIAELLLRACPELDEGQLSKRRSMLVRAPTLAAKARALGLGPALRLGRGEDRGGGREKSSILACTYESVIGAVFRDAGFERAKAVVARHFADDLARGGLTGAPDWKTMLQEQTQAGSRTVPEYRLAAADGPAHARQFTVEVWVDNTCIAQGVGSSKRDAEQDAARQALEATDR